MHKLLLFPHSHYCEKARWALDYKGIPYKAVAVMPGWHVISVRRYAPDTSVPVLLHDAHVIQDSTAIINYLDEQYPDLSLTPHDCALRKECRIIERAVDEGIGQNVRQILYHYLLSYPLFIEHCFMHSLGIPKKVMFRVLYPMLRRKIYHNYVQSDAQVQRAKQDFDEAIQQLNQRVAGRTFLVGDHFTRADLSAASMLSFLGEPAEHPFPWMPYPDAAAQAWRATYRDSPAVQWSLMIYRDFRNAKK